MDGRQQFPYVSSQLAALREKNYLTHFNGEKVIPGPVTVVATGNAPFNLLIANTTYRDIFFDAPLDQLTSSQPSSIFSYAEVDSRRKRGQGYTGTDLSLGSEQFHSLNSYYPSISFKSIIGFPWRGHLSQSQKRKIRAQIRAAHEKGLKARYWNTPNWPVGLRNHVWKILVEEGADYLNVDDLRSASMVDWGVAWRNRWARGGF